MKKVTLVSLIFAGLATTTSSFADENHKTFGLSFDLGVPDGAALGMVVRPVFEWARFDFAGTYNALAPGFRGGLTLDPINFGIAPTLTFEGGHAFNGKVPGLNNSPDVTYNYANIHLGLEFGSRNNWRFYLRGGLSYLDVSTENFQQTVNIGNDIVVGNPTLHGWIAPTAKFGFAIYF